MIGRPRLRKSWIAFLPFPRGPDSFMFKNAHRFREELWKGWEENLNSMCEEIAECTGATQLVEALTSTGLPMAIATSSRYAGVEKKRKRWVSCRRTIAASLRVQIVVKDFVKF